MDRLSSGFTRSALSLRSNDSGVFDDGPDLVGTGAMTLLPYGASHWLFWGQGNPLMEPRESFSGGAESPTEEPAAAPVRVRLPR